MSDTETVTPARKKLRRLERITAGWALLVGAVLIWQTVTYSGVIARLSEWQFGRFERMFPVSTILLITLLLSLPLLFLLVSRHRRYRRVRGEPPLTVQALRERRVSRWLAGSTLVMSGFALIAAILTLIQSPSDDGQTLSDMFGADAITKEGVVDARARVRTDLVGYYEKRGLFWKSGVYLAPIEPSTNPTKLTHFLVVDKASIGEPSEWSVRGYVRRTRLPGGFERLFGNTGYTLQRPAYVVYPDAGEAFRARFGLAESLLRFAFVIGLGWLLHRLLVRLRRRRDEEETFEAIRAESVS